MNNDMAFTSIDLKMIKFSFLKITLKDINKWNEYSKSNEVPGIA